MNALEAWQQRFPAMLDERIDGVIQQVQEQQTAESHVRFRLLFICTFAHLSLMSLCGQQLTLQRFKLLLDDLRSAQEEHVAELRLVHHEVS
jgi:hypothetical protein